MRINQNHFAKLVTLCEGGKLRISIAQVKEVLRCTLQEMRREMEKGNTSGVIKMIEDSGK